MFLVDSHCHLDQLDLTPYQGDLTKAIAFAEEQGVKHFLNVCITIDDLSAVLSAAELFPSVSASVGLHPNETVDQEPELRDLIELAQHPKVVAIGETGLDYYRSAGDLDWQRERFRTHIRAAIQSNRPLIVHSRQAKADTIKILKEENAAAVGGVLHCFTEDWEMAQQALELNFYISFSGIVTFKNAEEVQRVAKELPLDRMLIETDSPYLAPNPFRGKPNEPAYVRHVAEFIATLRGVKLDIIAEATTKNFFTLFKMAAKNV